MTDTVVIRPADQMSQHDLEVLLKKDDLDKVADLIGRQNIVYIAGIAHQLLSYSDPDDTGARTAVIMPLRPF